jgi:histidyl-tRNA synthetase
VERILLAAGDLPTAVETTDLFVAVVPGSTEAARVAFDIANEARHAGLAARMELAGRSLKGQLKHADRIGARYVAIISDDETSLRNMESGEQQTLGRSAVIATVLRGERL